VLVWDDDGQTRVSYLSPTALAARHGLADPMAAPLAGIDRLTDTAITDASGTPELRADRA